MTDQELERRLAQALDHAAPNDLLDVLSRCGVGKGTVIHMADVKKTSGGRRWRPLIAAALALVLLGGGAGGIFWRQANAVASIVSLDVNPSIELKVSRSEKVLSCTAMNEDAAAILFDMGGGEDLKGTKLDVAVNAIVGSLLRNGYLNDLASAILISVEDGDQARAARLQEELVATVDRILQGADNTSSVYSQAMTPEDMPALETLQAQSSISSGKAALVKRVMEMNGTDQADVETQNFLSALSVEELMDLLETGETRLPIGMSAASALALEYAGAEGAEGVTADVDPELDDVTPHYDVDIRTPDGEFEYQVDAFRGTVLSGQKDILSQTGSQQPSATDIGEAAARDAALKHAGVSSGDATFTKTRKDTDSGRAEYDVEFTAGGYRYEYEIDAATGSVLQSEKEPLPAAGTGSSGTQQPSATDIGEAAARDAALKHAGVSSASATFIKTQKDYDNGRAEYDIEFTADGTKYEYEIDAATGSVLKSEREAVGQTGGSGSTADIGTEAAKTAAFRHAGVSASDVTLIQARQDRDDGRTHYDIEFTAGGYRYEYEIDAASGTVLKSEKEQTGAGGSGHHEEEHHSTGTSGTSGDIGLEAAKQAALTHAGLSASQVTGLKAEQDRDDGRLEYEVEFRSGNYEYEYTIDGTSGVVLQHEKDWDD